MEEAPVCEVCGKPATAAVGDSVELEPLPGAVFRTFEPLGVGHWYCAEHERPPVQYRREMPGGDEMYQSALARAMAGVRGGGGVEYRHISELPGKEGP